MQLIDTSAIYDMISKKEADSIRQAFILDLTIYEFANVIWKQHKFRKLEKKDCDILIENFTKLGFKMIRINPEDIQTISAIAIETGITVYDAAYVYYAEKFGLKLVTSDQKLGAAWTNRAVRKR